MSVKSLIRSVVRLSNGEISTKRLISMGMRVGYGFHRGRGCFIDPSHCFLITIGNNVTMSINVTVLAHDASTAKLTGYTKIGQVKIGNNVFIGAGVVILPGVTIGDNSIIAAGSVVAKSIQADTVCAGVPAKTICDVRQYADKHKKQMKESRCFSEEYTMRHRLNNSQKAELITATIDRMAYIV